MGGLHRSREPSLESVPRFKSITEEVRKQKVYHLSHLSKDVLPLTHGHAGDLDAQTPPHGFGHRRWTNLDTYRHCIALDAGKQDKYGRTDAVRMLRCSRSVPTSIPLVMPTLPTRILS